MNEKLLRRIERHLYEYLDSCDGPMGPGPSENEAKQLWLEVVQELIGPDQSVKRAGLKMLGKGFPKEGM